MNFLLPNYSIEAIIIVNLILLIVSIVFIYRSKETTLTKVVLLLLALFVPLIGSILLITYLALTNKVKLKTNLNN